jgi:hypothetical protein
MERAMGIEYIAEAKLVHSNHEVASKDARCVRFSCEKHRYQPTSANAAIGSGHTSFLAAAASPPSYLL